MKPDSAGQSLYICTKVSEEIKLIFESRDQLRDQLIQRIATPIFTVGLLFLLIGLFSLSQAASLIAPAIDQMSKISANLESTKESVDKLTVAVLQLQNQLAVVPK